MELDVDYQAKEAPLERFRALRREMAALHHDHSFIVRRLFVTAAVLMLLFLPHLGEAISFPLFISIAAIIILVIAAGFTSFARPVTIFIDAIFSFIAMIVFEYQSFITHSANYNFYFLANQALAIIFLFAFYESLKTIRAIWLDDVEEKRAQQIFMGKET